MPLDKTLTSSSLQPTLAAQLLGKGTHVTETGILEDIKLSGIAVTIPSRLNDIEYKHFTETTQQVITAFGNLSLDASVIKDTRYSGRMKGIDLAGIRIEMMQTLSSLTPYQLPFERNQEFVGRVDILDTLQQRLQQEQLGVSTQTIQGLGGIGKTQLAVEYAYHHCKEYDFIGWFNGKALEQEYLKLADQLKVPKDLDSAERIQAVMQQLKACSRWLLIIDDAPDYKTIKPYIPKSSGHVIITTRHTEQWKKPITLKAFTLKESIALLKEILHESNELKSSIFDQDASALAELLGYLPLALAQAGAYIKNTNNTLSGYIKLFETRRQALWQRETAPKDYSKTVAVTWGISIQAARKKVGPLANSLMNLLGHFAYLQASVPQWLLTTLIEDELDFNDIISALKAYSLIIGNQELSLHTLVQHMLRDTTDVNYLQVAKWLSAIWPEGDSLLSLLHQRQLVPQGQCIFAYANNDASLTTARLLGNIGISCMRLGQPNTAKRALIQMLEIEEVIYGKNSYHVARTLNNLAVAYGALGDTQQKKTLLERALRIQEKHYSKDHSDVACTLGNLANAYGDLGNIQQQKALLKQVLRIEEVYYGRDHYEVARTLGNLATAYGNLGDFQQAKMLLEQALGIEEVHYGKDHYEVARTLGNLATAYGDLGDIQHQKALLEQALGIEEAHYGKDHYKVARTLGNLANAYGDLDDVQQQKTLLEQALPILENHYGKNHYEVARTLSNLATVYEKLEDFEQQKTLLDRALTIQEAYYGKDHYEVALTLDDLATAYEALGDFHHQKALLERALAIQEARYGKNHYEVAYTLANLADACGNLGDVQQQKSLLEQALVIQKEHFGKGHNDLALLTHLADAYLQAQEYSIAIELYQQALEQDKSHIGCWSTLALCYRLLNDNIKAAWAFEQGIATGVAQHNLYVEYALWLYGEGHYQTALDKLLAIETHDESELYFGPEEIERLEPALQTLADEDNTLILQSFDLAWYLRIRCLQQLNKPYLSYLEAFHTNMKENPSLEGYQLLCSLCVDTSIAQTVSAEYEALQVELQKHVEQFILASGNPKELNAAQYPEPILKIQTDKSAILASIPNATHLQRNGFFQRKPAIVKLLSEQGVITDNLKSTKK